MTELWFGGHGRTAGWIALYAGVAGDADCIVVPNHNIEISLIRLKREDQTIALYLDYCRRRQNPTMKR